MPIELLVGGIFGGPEDTQRIDTQLEGDTRYPVGAIPGGSEVRAQTNACLLQWPLTSTGATKPTNLQCSGQYGHSVDTEDTVPAHYLQQSELGAMKGGARGGLVRSRGVCNVHVLVQQQGIHEVHGCHGLIHC